MAVTISGTNGIDKVQDGTIQSADFAAGIPAVSDLPAGTVLQVVSATSTTNQTVTTNTAILTASITPTSASNKVFAIASLGLTGLASSNSYTQAALQRGATVIDSNFAGQSGTTNSTRILYALQGLDSPGSATSQTYTLYIDKASGGTTSVTTDSARYTITLMEIAA